MHCNHVKERLSDDKIHNQHLIGMVLKLLKMIFASQSIERKGIILFSLRGKVGEIANSK